MARRWLVAFIGAALAAGAPTNSASQSIRCIPGLNCPEDRIVPPAPAPAPPVPPVNTPEPQAPRPSPPVEAPPQRAPTPAPPAPPAQPRTTVPAPLPSPVPTPRTSEQSTWEIIIECPPTAGFRGGTAPETQHRLRDIAVSERRISQDIRMRTSQGRTILLNVRADFSVSPARLTMEERLDPNAIQPSGTNPLTFSGNYTFEFQSQNFLREVTQGQYVSLGTGWRRQCLIGFTAQNDINSQ